MNKDNYIFFWGGVFSNFYQVDTKETSEKWFMLEKAAFFKDSDSYKAIIKTSHPRDAKKLGRKVSGFNEKEWNGFKETAMMNSLRRKYRECEPFKEALDASEHKILVEASPYDRIWGIGFGVDEALDNINDWGQNLLGECLMKLRKEMR